MKLEDQIQFNINLSNFDRLTRNNNKPTKSNIMKKFIYNYGGYILFATAILVTILWKVFFPNLHW